MKLLLRHFVPCLLLACLIWSCEDEVSIDLKDADPVFTVDAWLENVQDTQRIMLTRSTDYFNNETLAPGVADAAVSIVDEDGMRYDFDHQGDGIYQWVSPVEGQGFGEIGMRYDLTIISGGVTYTSSTLMKPTSVIDSVYFVQDEDPFEGEFVRADFQARDLETENDTYWVKAYKNGELLNKIGEINIAYDAGFTEGGGDDQNGKTFIPPIRFAINDFDKLPIYETNDTVRVEIHSIAREAFTFLNLLRFQGGREAGLAALFEDPLNNVNTNITSSNAGELVIGIFNVAAVESNERILVESEVVVRD